MINLTAIYNQDITFAVKNNDFDTFEKILFTEEERVNENRFEKFFVPASETHDLPQYYGMRVPYPHINAEITVKKKDEERYSVESQINHYVMWGVVEYVVRNDKFGPAIYKPNYYYNMEDIKIGGPTHRCFACEYSRIVRLTNTNVHPCFNNICKNCPLYDYKSSFNFGYMCEGPDLETINTITNYNESLTTELVNKFFEVNSSAYSDYAECAGFFDIEGCLTAAKKMQKLLWAMQTIK